MLVAATVFFDTRQSASTGQGLAACAHSGRRVPPSLPSQRPFPTPSETPMPMYDAFEKGPIVVKTAVRRVVLGILRERTLYAQAEIEIYEGAFELDLCGQNISELQSPARTSRSPWTQKSTTCSLARIAGIFAAQAHHT
ncbi:hypothetical protein C8Q73DRAFT_284664 [Cubamyces lactineus]|nr:hypothetical protein C8Q73DRAFT_284664 [Cubamyces lactineus]